MYNNPYLQAMRPQMQQRMNPFQMMQGLRSDPAGFLQRAGLNIPAGLNDPQQIVQHLMQSGQVPQQRFQQLMQMMQGFRWS